MDFRVTITLGEGGFGNRVDNTLFAKDPVGEAILRQTGFSIVEPKFSLSQWTPKFFAWQHSEDTCGLVEMRYPFPKTSVVAVADSEKCKLVTMRKDDCSCVEPIQECLAWIKETNQKLREEYDACLKKEEAKQTKGEPPQKPCEKRTTADCSTDYIPEYRACVAEVRKHNADCDRQTACDEATQKEHAACDGLPFVHGGGRDGAEMRAEDKKNCEKARAAKQESCRKE